MRRPRLQQLASGRALVLSLVALAAFSTVARVLLGTGAHAPTVFNDELGYTKLAQSIGLDGRFALFDKEGFTYSPLYPALLAPIYFLGASAPTAYALIKVVNAVLISLAVFPLYRVARFVLTPERSLLAAAVCVFAPLMSYPAFTMSENLAYPLCGVALWAMLAAVQRPAPSRDAVLLAAIAVATAARIQLVVLLPAALTAFLVAGLTDCGGTVGRRLLRCVRVHWLIFGVAALGLLAAGTRALAGGDVYSAFGRYADVGEAGLPSASRVLELALHHLAGLDLAVGVIAFVASMVAAFAFVRGGRPAPYVPFAAVALSFTFWVLLQVAMNAATFDAPGLDIPRIHERFMIYVVPLFVVALLATVGLHPASASQRVYLGAAAIAAALPAVIPFDRYVNTTNGVDTFSLLPFGHSTADGYEAVPWARLAAVVVAATFGLTYVRMLRGSLRRTTVYALVVFGAVSAFVWSRVDSASAVGRSVLPQHADWVDRAAPAGDVVLVADADSLPALETAYFSLRIQRVYTRCDPVFTAEFGERQVSIDEAGRIRAGAEHVQAAYAAVPARLRLQGRVVARNPAGRQVLVAPAGRRLAVASVMRQAPC